MHIVDPDSNAACIISAPLLRIYVMHVFPNESFQCGVKNGQLVDPHYPIYMKKLKSIKWMHIRYTCAMQPPRPIPSKNWWKQSAAMRGLIVSRFEDVPNDIPIITECTTIPISSTCTYIYAKALVKHNYACLAFIKLVTLRMNIILLYPCQLILE